MPANTHSTPAYFYRRDGHAICHILLFSINNKGERAIRGKLNRKNV